MDAHENATPLAYIDRKILAREELRMRIEEREGYLYLADLVPTIEHWATEDYADALRVANSVERYANRLIRH
jgi:hypothetical protein